MELDSELPGHDWLLQILSSLKSPWHCAPPSTGSTQVRVRMLVPPPQVVVQGDQSPHTLHAPSTAMTTTNKLVLKHDYPFPPNYTNGKKQEYQTKLTWTGCEVASLGLVQVTCARKPAIEGSSALPVTCAPTCATGERAGGPRLPVLQHPVLCHTASESSIKTFHQSRTFMQQTNHFSFSDSYLAASCYFVMSRDLLENGHAVLSAVKATYTIINC